MKLFFALSNVALEAFIACRDAKRHYDTARPWTLVHTLFAGQQVWGYGGPGQDRGPSR